MRILALLVLAIAAMAQNPNVPLSQNALGTVAYILNAGSAGTTLNKLASLTGAPSKVVITTAGATSGVVGIVTSGAGTTGTATVQVTGGSIPCVFDGSTTAGDYVQISASVNGDCTDAGSTLPASGQILGRVLTTNSGAGTYKLDLQPSIGIPSSGPGSGTVTSVTCGTGLTGGTITTTGTCAVGPTVVQTNQSNTYSTGTQDFTSATNTLVTTQATSDNSTKAASTAYVTTGIANAIAGVNPAVAVLAASTANITGTYNNGVSGIGATFTVTATGTFTLDGITINTIGQRVLLKDQSTGFQNGVYTATVVGAIAVQPIFTRALDYDAPSDINSTGAIPVQSGTVNTTTSWLLTSTVNTVGTDALTYVKFSINPTTVAQTIASGTKALATGAISSASCTSAQTSSATGTLTTDVVSASFNGDPTAVTGFVPLTTGMLTIIIYPTADTFNAKVCNNTSASITPGAITLNWRVTR